MGRGGFSKDPAVAAQQRAALAAGRAEAAERRKQGLPTKRREAAAIPGSPGSRVKRGTYAGSPAKSPAKTKAASPAVTGKRRSPAKAPANESAKLSTVERVYAKLLGY